MSKRLFTPWFGRKLFGILMLLLVPTACASGLLYQESIHNISDRLIFMWFGMMSLVFIAQLYSLWHRDDLHIWRTQGSFDCFMWWLTSLVSAPLALFGVCMIYAGIKGIALDELSYL
jgi:hypothetical protein